MNQDFRHQVAERSNSLRIDGPVNGLLTLIAVGLVSFSVDALLHAMH